MNNKIPYILKIREITDIDKMVDFRLDNNSDGTELIIAHWNITKLGAQPTVQELSNLDVDQAYIDYVAGEDTKRERPNVSRANLKTIAGLRTLLTESDEDTLLRSDAQKLKIATLGTKHLLRLSLNDIIEDMQV